MLAADGDECAARVVFLTLNDVYALHANDDGVGGVAEMATLLAHTRRAIEVDDPEATVVVTLNGDFLWRSELDRRDKGALMVQVLNALGIEFVVLGNHEFDFGAPTLQELLSSARFQCLGSNIRSTATGDLLGGVVDTAIIEVQHGLRLGLFGVCTTETEEDALAGDTVRFEDEVLHARRCVELLQRESADVVVALTHLPMQRDKQLARQVSGISLVLGGHDHDVMTDVVGHTMIHKSGQDAHWLGRVELTIHKRLEEDNTTELARPPSVYFAWEMLLNRGFHPHTECLALVKEYERMVDADDEAQGKLEPLAVATAALDGTRYTSRRRDCDVGFLITDAMRAELQADVALIHAGLIKGDRLYAPGCVITPRWLERVLPHPRRTAVVSMSADCLRLALERMLRRYPSLSSSTPHPRKHDRNQLCKIAATTIDHRPASSQSAIRTSFFRSLIAAMGAASSQSLYDDPKPTIQELQGTQTSAHGNVRLSEWQSPYKPHMTLYTNLMDRRRVDDGSRPIFGWRPMDPKTGAAGDYEWITYSAFLDQVDAVAAGMVHALQLRRQEPVGVFAKNRYEWVLVEHGCNRMAYQLVPLYDTLGPTAVPFILNQTEMRVIFVAKAQWPALADAIKQSPSVKHVVQFEDVSEEQRKEAAALNVALTGLKELLSVGEKKPVAADPPTPDDICTICYTSGTTGNPKGALLTHANMVSAALAANTYSKLNKDDVHLSYLPLAHVLERTVQNIVIGEGGSVGFFQGEVSKLLSDLAALRPTMLPSVPRVLNRIHDSILQGVSKASPAKRWLFNRARDAKVKRVRRGVLHHSVWDPLVFDKIKQLLGGRVRIMLNGSAPITRDCKEFLQVVFGCPVLEGYGMTETCAIISITTPSIAPGTHVGPPAPGLEVCLFDVPEMNYTSADQPNPRGEICVRGPDVFKGYYKDPEKTAEAIDADGWLHTGDIGQWNPDGTLSIIDRKKNIFKLSQGEYVAPEKIENVYVKSPLVAQIFVHGHSLQNYLVGVAVPDADAIFVHGHSLQNYLVGVAVPDADAVAEWARANGHSAEADALRDLYSSAALKQAILKDLDELAQRFGLMRFERVQKLHLHDELWSVENNLLTPTFKLKRPQLVEYFSKQIDFMYDANAPAF
ncbi:hypothetical protein ATCC90586_004254 [Pythium insidiosum]|nr:hypothetical protein ATCC90586_004254 [Pythium insidiosum]